MGEKKKKKKTSKNILSLPALCRRKAQVGEGKLDTWSLPSRGQSGPETDRDSGDNTAVTGGFLIGKAQTLIFHLNI